MFIHSLVVVYTIQNDGLLKGICIFKVEIWPSVSISVGYERKFFELERAERKNFRAEPSASDITRNDFRAEPSSSGKSFERLRARAKPSEHKSFFEHDFLFNFEHSRAEFER